MLQFLSGRLSVPARVLLVAACAAPPVIVLLLLFIRQIEREYHFTAEELKGAAYIAQVWPVVVSGGAPELPESGGGPGQFGAESQARAFVSAPSGARVTRGADFIHAVADGSNLTLDTDLGSFYAMDAATVALPGLLAAATSFPGPAADRFALGKAQALEDAALRDIEEAIRHDRSGLAREALKGQSQLVHAAFEAFLRDPASPVLRGRLTSAVDGAWRADEHELVRLLEARQAHTRSRDIASLILIILTLAAAVALAVGMTRSMGAQLKALLHTVDRLNAGDTKVAIPFLQDRTETGRIAAALDSFRQGLIESERERLRAEAAAEAVRESEARYRMLADNSSDVILHYAADFRLLYVSPSVRLFGYSPEEVLGAEAMAFVHPEDLEAVKQRREDGLAGRETKPLDARLRKADGEWLWFESTMTPIRDAAGALSGFISTFRNIHKRKLAEEAMTASEALYRFLADNISDVLLRYDADLRIQYVSPAIRQWGYTPEDFVGRPAGTFVHPDDRQRVAERGAAMLRGEAAQTIEARVCCADGSSAWAESKATVIRKEDGTVVAVVLVLRDISQRKAAEAALIDSEARYRMLADNTSDIIQKFNADGIVEYVSPSVRQIGYEPEHFIGRAPAMLTDSADREEVLKRRDELLSGRPVPAHESRARCADGRIIWLESRPSPIHDDQGKFVGVVNVLRDVTARKAAQAAMQELNQELRRVARASALGAFAGSLAHEVNQPLAAAAISGEAALRWLSTEPANHERGVQAMRRAVDDIRRAADVVGRMRALVTKSEPVRIEFDADEAIREVLALTERERERFGVRTQTELGAAPAMLHGDRVQFQQVMINLVLNAVEAMRETPQDERLLLIGSRSQAGWLDFRVEDRGPGVEADKQSQIFESLFTTKVGGTGLGLAISKSIVESHGGVIAVEPAAPQGVVFTVRLPAAGRAAAAEA